MTTLTTKLFAVGALILVLLIPAAMIDSMVSERRGRRDAAIAEIHEAWSGAQFVRGPILAIPARVVRGLDKDGRQVYDLVEARFLPEELTVAGSVDTEPRYRGIYKTAVYTARLELTGRFGPPNFAALGLSGAEIYWDRAAITVGVEDPRGIKDASGGSWAGKPLDFEPGSAGIPEIKTGLVAAVASGPLRERGASFAIPVTVRGSGGLSFLPVGRTTEVSLRSAWPRPSFWGAFLPDKREIGTGGFTAAWKVLHINRSLPAEWTGAMDLSASRFGVNLLAGTDNYSSASRSTKYAVLFVFLTFLAFFLVEFFQEKRLHPVQYLMVGSALVLFYLLLLSLSEQIAFGAAYAAASAAVIAVITGYAHGVFRRAAVTGAVAATVGALYGYLYILLRMEDYALLLGSFGLLAALSLVMYLTRGVDWYDIEKAPARLG